jgi:hypothetical protein
MPEESGAYIALSYCWGGPQSAITTSTNIEARTRAIPLTELPRTIREAVTVTRSLRIRYLWVDAICINQDDIAEKTKEIAVMGNIYKNAILTIAAGSAASTDEGFLMKRSLPAACCLPFYVSEQQSGTIWLQDQKTFKRPMEPLDSRAWTMQEFLLSTRILYYGTKEVAWRCRTENFKGFISFDGSGSRYPAPSTTYFPQSLSEKTKSLD